ncbi:MAG: DUF3828 domain-containing protein [Alphaproteobacteria bacterium]|nr:DUF3828 domain-containing protein [Alphaproteobacteria bacterium]
MMRMNVLWAAVAAVVLCTSAQAAPKIDDPVIFVRWVYAEMATDKNFAYPEDALSPRLKALEDLDKREAGGEVGRLDFDFFANAQDWSISDLSVTGAPVENAKDREVVTAQFKNGKRKNEIHFYFEKTAAGWKLDDARSVIGGSWTLSLILKYGWDTPE